MDLLFAGDFDPTLRAALPGGRPLGPERRPGSDPAVGTPWPTASAASPVSYFSPGVYATTDLRGGAAALVAVGTAPPARLRRGQVAVGLDPGRAARPVRPPHGLRRLAGRAALPAVADRARRARDPNGPVPGRARRWCYRVRTTFALRSRPRVRVAARLPNASVLVVPDAGPQRARLAHRRLRSVGGSQLLASAGRSRAACASREFAPIDPIAPTALSQLDPAGGVGGRVGRTLAAVTATLEDMGIQLTRRAVQPRRVQGQRRRPARRRDEPQGLWAAARPRACTCPVSRVSGELRGDAALARLRAGLRQRCAHAGRLRLRARRLSGRLAGRRVRLRLPPRCSAARSVHERRKKRGGARLTPLARAAAIRSLDSGERIEFASMAGPRHVHIRRQVVRPGDRACQARRGSSATTRST